MLVDLLLMLLLLLPLRLAGCLLVWTAIFGINNADCCL